jgi:hypothetical protein
MLEGGDIGKLKGTTALQQAAASAQGRAPLLRGFMSRFGETELMTELLAR